MNDTEAKYHHLIPQTYMSAWANKSGTLQIEFLNHPDVIVQRNKNKIAGISNYYSIKAGMVICTKEDTDILFKPLDDYIVEFNERILSNTLEMNQMFCYFDDWIIKRKDGSDVRKRAIKSEIDNIKIKDIEVKWSTKYEDKWNDVVDDLESALLGAKTNIISAIYKDYLMKFFVMLDWRSIQSNNEFQKAFQMYMDVFDDSEIPENERFLSCLKTVKDEIKHSLLLKFYRNFLNDNGVIFIHATESLKHTNFHFLIADGPTYFDTSDNPSFIFDRQDGLKEGLMPITPRILMVQGKCSDDNDADKYYVTHITDTAVKKYNVSIKDNANEFVIHPNVRTN